MKIDAQIALERLKFYRDELHPKDLVTIGIYGSIQEIYNAKSHKDAPASYKDGRYLRFRKEDVYDFIKNKINQPRDDFKDLQDLVVSNRNTYSSQVTQLQARLAAAQKTVTELSVENGKLSYECGEARKKYEKLKEDSNIQFLIEQNNKNVLKIKELEEKLRRPWWKII